MAPWWQRGAVYQIYPRSFADSDGDGVGDLRGITARLDHLVGLGVEALWLSPFYRSPMADFGYDVSDYRDVDPLFGTLDDFDALVAAAHERDLRVVVDFVPNHSSDQHPWFQAARSSQDDPHRGWYVFREGTPEDGPPNAWRSAFKAVGPAWSFDEQAGGWYLHSFLPQQPELDWDEPALEAEMHDVLRFWLDRGVDGFRIDVVNKLAKAPGLPDAVEGEPVPFEDWVPAIHDRLRRLRRVVDAYPDRVLIGEVYVLDLERMLAYVNTGDELDLAHDFIFLHLPWDAAAFREHLDALARASTGHAWPAWFLSNHDHPRVASRWDHDGLGADRARAVLLMLYALRGTPFLYQGEELGLPDAEIPPDRVVDVDGRDPERAPIPWAAPSQAGPGAGFTTGEPWLPVTAQAERLNVAAQDRDPASTLALTRRLAALRRAEPLLQTGAMRTLDAGPEILAWERTDAGGGRLVVAVSFASHARPTGLEGTGELVLSSSASRQDGRPVDLAALVLDAAEGVVVRTG